MHHNKITQCILIAASVALAGPAYAANVPSGIQLAQKQNIVIGNGTELATLDPQKAQGVPESNVIRQVLEGLVTQDEDGNVIPGVATRWETPDNKTYTFHLRENAKWSNGEPVTAQDFVYSWERAVDPATASPYAWYYPFAKIKNAQDIVDGKKDKSTLGVKALDDHTFTVELDTPLPYFVTMTAHTTMKPVNKSVVEKFGDKWTKPEHFVGNGAYVLDDWVVNERMELSRSKTYWNNDKTVIEHATILPVDNAVSEMNRFLAHEIDITSTIPPEHFKRLKKEHPDSVSVVGNLCSYYYQFNSQRKPFDDVRVRKALSYAIDRDVITKGVLGQGQKPAYFLTPEITANFNPIVPSYGKMSQRERNLEAARLLKVAGYDHDHPLKVKILYNTSESHKKLAVAISSMWKKTLGVETELENQEWKTYLSSQNQGDFEVVRGGWCGDYNEPSTFLSMMISSYPGAGKHWKNKEYDAILDSAARAKTEKERTEIYNEAERMLTKEMPIAPIYQYVSTRLINPKVGGFPVNNAEGKVYLKDLYKIQ